MTKSAESLNIIDQEKAESSSVTQIRGERPGGVFRGSRISRALQKAAMAFGVFGVAAWGADKAGITSRSNPEPVRVSKDVVMSYDGDGKLVRVVDNRDLANKAVFVSKNNTGEYPPVSGQHETVKSKTEVKKDPLKIMFPDASTEQLAAIYRSVTAVEGDVAHDVNFETMQEFLAKYGDFLEKQSAKHNLDPDIVKGLIFIESSGDSNAVSPAGAVGVGQQMREMAIMYGLRVDDEVDERKEPLKAIPVTCKYLSHLQDTFGDMSIAIWAYHAGEGNVMDAINAKSGGRFEGYQEILTGNNERLRLNFEKRVRGFLSDNKINVFTLMGDGDVQGVLSKLEDDTGRYSIKTLAAVKLLNGSTLYFNKPFAKAS